MRLRLLPIVLFLLPLDVLISSCTLGTEDSPGCRKDHPEDCENGWTCRAGVCFKPSTGLSAYDASDSSSDDSSDSSSVDTSDVATDASAGD